MLHRKQFYLACFFSCHFLFVVVIGCGDIVAFIARGYTWLPGPVSAVAQKMQTTLSAAFERLQPSLPVRQGITTYAHLGGIEAGYSFFAPSVPDNFKLVFELHYPDGRVEYDLPHASTSSAGLRLATLIDNIGETDSDDLREVMVKMLAYSVWQAHPEVTMIRAVFGFARIPTAAEFRRGIRESDEFLFAYDFVFPSPGDGKVP